MNASMTDHDRTMPVALRTNRLLISSSPLLKIWIRACHAEPIGFAQDELREASLAQPTRLFGCGGRSLRVTYTINNPKIPVELS
jgi:hypothetical protein